jgi:hypothetical protein
VIEAKVLSEVMRAATELDDWGSLGLSASGDTCGVHVAVMLQPFFGYILEGRKTVETRFSKMPIAPYLRVAEGDVVLLKAGTVRASFRASSVEFVEVDTKEQARLARDFSDAICADQEFWRARENKRHATLIGIADVRRLTPITISKKDRRGWLVLRETGRPGRR